MNETDEANLVAIGLTLKKHYCEYKKENGVKITFCQFLRELQYDKKTISYITEALAYKSKYFRKNKCTRNKVVQKIRCTAPGSDKISYLIEHHFGKIVKYEDGSSRWKWANIEDDVFISSDIHTLLKILDFLKS